MITWQRKNTGSVLNNQFTEMPKDGELRFKTPFPVTIGHFSDTITPGIDYSKFLNLGKDMYQKQIPRYYKRHSIVPNIPGQKYTIGNRFVSKKEQGEFILCKNDDIGSSHCEIICDEDGKFWVFPINNHPTFINEEAVLEKSQLHFGDHLILIRESNGTFFKENFVKFLFMEREFHSHPLFRGRANKIGPIPILDSGNQFVDFIHKNNEVILCKILAFIPHNQLKSSRYISTSFNSAAKRILSKSSIARLEFPKAAQGDTLCFHQYLNEMKNMNLKTLKLDLWNKPNNPFNMGEKLLEDLTSFLENIDINSINELHLSFSFEPIFNAKVVALIFEKFGKTLKNLVLSGRFRMMDTNDDIPHLSSLTSLSLQIYYNSKKNLDWISKFIKCCPSVRKFYSINPENDLWIEKTPEFKSLEEFELLEIFPQNLGHLMELDKPLKKLWLGELRCFSNDHLSLFEQLLEKYAQSLVALKFVLSSEGAYVPQVYPRVVTSGVTVLKLPAFPKLKCLAIEQKLIPGQREFSFKFGDEEELDYEMHFPVLEQLELGATTKYNDEHNDEKGEGEEEDVDCWEDAFSQFIKNGTVCKSLTKLNVAQISEVGKLKEIFPNVAYF